MSRLVVDIRYIAGIDCHSLMLLWIMPPTMPSTIVSSFDRLKSGTR
jgi:hypothetical protein